jgi:hypothetical protein
MQTFDFPYHTFRTEYPESGNRVQLGGNYIFTAPPNGPDLRRFTLKFETMVYYVYPDGSIDEMKNPSINMGKLEAFYNAHKLHRSFLYPHPVYGNLEVKFMSPLKIPEGIKGGNGALNDFEIDLIEISQ